MRKVISKLLLLALVAGIGNAQAPGRPVGGPPGRPQSPADAGKPGRPNVVPNAPTRQQAPITRPQNAPTRATPAPNNNNAVNRPSQPNRPLPNPQQPQQLPPQRPGTPTRQPTGPGPVRPTPAPPAANVPRPGQPPATDAPAANVPRPGQPQATTTPETTTTRRINVQPPNTDGNQEPDLDNFPTAPTIAPTPDVIFVTTSRTPNGNNPVHPNIPITPWNPRVGEGRPDQRCPLSQDSRNPTHLAHESDCSRFYKCDHGIAFEYRCPEGQHWNARRNYCDFPNNANCRPGSQGPSIGVPVLPNPNPSPQVPDWNNHWNGPQNNNQWNGQPNNNNQWMGQPNNNNNMNRPNNNNNWNHPNNNIVPWTSPPLNSNPGFEHPIIIPMAPRS